MIEEREKEKSRHLSPLDYLEILSIEFLLARLRGKIFPREKDKIFQKKLTEEKKIKILDISQKGCIPNIFTADTEMRRIQDKVFGSGGFPNFHYTEASDFEYGKKDFYKYYAKGSDVKIIAERLEVGKIESANKDEGTVDVIIRDQGKATTWGVSTVTRIIT